MPANDLPLLIAAVQEAGALALRYWQKDPEHWEKDAGAGPVSEADLAVNALLDHRLRHARPDYGWLSEETADTPARLSARRCFILDPIDGTRAFLAGESSFAVALAVVEDGTPIAGVVHLPARDLLYAATSDGPATLNGAPIRCRAPGARPQVLTSSQALAPAFWKTPPQVDRHFRPSLAWRFCLVAEGRFDATLSVRPAWEWDIAAGALIAARAGVTVTDTAGKPLRFNQPTPQAPGLLVAPPPLHAQLHGALRQIPG